ncbi:MAG: radical SAM family heme chaperone HemW [Ignavibacteria bacterium]
MSGIYIHIPFCRKRCNYCDFFFITNTKLKSEYLSALKKEIVLHSENYKTDKFDTVFLGGGTPSVLSDIEVAEVLSILRDNFNISDSSEITLESNPEDLENNASEKYFKAGINRFSFGVQSFIDSELKFLTRQHTSESAEIVIRRAAESTENISVDIIYSLPSQNPDDVIFSISKAIESGANHISAYSLTYEKGTLLYKSLEKNPDIKNNSEKDSELFNSVSEKLLSEGFIHYEVSNFARPGFESRHNLKYWTYENYLGLGPSAHSFFYNERWNNPSSFSKYVNSLKENKLPSEDRYRPEKDQMKLEYIMLGLRSIGIDFVNFEEIFEEDFKVLYKNSIYELLEKNYAVATETGIKLNEKGYSVADEITVRYF